MDKKNKNARFTDIENLSAKEQALRRLSGQTPQEAGDPISEGIESQALEDPLLSPDDLIDPSTGVKIAKAGLMKGGPAMAAIVGQLLTRKEGISVLKKSIDEATGLVDPKKLIENIGKYSNDLGELTHNLRKTHGSTILEVLGKQENQGREAAEQLYKNVSPVTPMQDRLMKDTVGGRYHSNSGIITINKHPDIDDISRTGTRVHELQHAKEEILSPGTTGIVKPYSKINESSIDMTDPQAIERFSVLKKLRPEIENINDLNSNELIELLAQKHHTEYPKYLEAEQAAQLYNKAIKNESAQLDTDVTPKLVSKYLKRIKK